MAATWEVIESTPRPDKCEINNGGMAEKVFQKIFWHEKRKHYDFKIIFVKGCHETQKCKYDDDANRICFCGVNFDEVGGQCVAKAIVEGEETS